MRLRRGARISRRAFRGALVLSAFAARASAAMPAPPEPDSTALRYMQSVVDAWEISARRDLRLPAPPLSWMIFYDDSAAWHFNAEAKLLPPHTTAKATLRFGGKRYALERVPNRVGLWVPDPDVLPIAPRAATMLYANGRKPYSIIPLPALYRRAAPPEESAELDKIFLGVAIHELTHTRHLVDVGGRIEQVRKTQRLPDALDDDIIEERFSIDTAYVPIFAEERKALTDAVFAATVAEAKQAARAALDAADRRRATFLSGDNAGLAELDDFFLVMEGTAMWAQYQTARRSAAPTETWQRTLSILMNRTASWSQGEGLALFLLLDRFQPGWQTRFMARGFPSPFAALRSVVR